MTPEEKSYKALKARLWLLYRITPEEQQQVEEWQRTHGMSILMGDSLEGTGTDHDHNSGLVRGRLAYLLNKAMGLVEARAKAIGVSTALLLRALAFYAENPPAVQAIGKHYGLIGKAQRKKKMIYGSPNGPLPAVIAPRKKNKKGK